MNTSPSSTMIMQAAGLAKKAKRTKILYWVLTGLFALVMLMDGVAGALQEQTGQEVMKHLGYPIYVLIICGVAKILGAIALLQTRFCTIKEWAYAGFTINFVGACASWAFAGDGVAFQLPPLIMLGFLFLTYYFWKKVTLLQGAI